MNPTPPTSNTQILEGNTACAATGRSAVYTASHRHEAADEGSTPSLIKQHKTPP